MATESGAAIGRLTTRADRVVRVKPRSGWALPDLSEMLAYRELLLILVRRNIKIRYKQTALGVAWAVLQPILGTVVFTVFFNHVAGIKSLKGLPYPVFALSGLATWNFFSIGLTQASDSLVSGAALVSKVYFPRMLVPLAAVLAGGIDFVVTLILLLVVMAAYGLTPGIAVLWLPVFALLLASVTVAFSVFSSALNTRYRDVRYVVPFLTQLWLFLTPIVYPSSLLHGPWRTIIGLNPMVGVVDGVRWCMIARFPRPGLVLVPSLLVTAVVLFGSLLYFARAERTMADVV